MTLVSAALRTVGSASASTLSLRRDSSATRSAKSREWSAKRQSSAKSGRDGLRLGIFPAAAVDLLAEQGTADNISERSDAIQALQDAMQHAKSDKSLFAVHLPEIVALLGRLVNDQHFKVAYGAMHVLASVVAKAGAQVAPVVEQLVALLLEKAGDVRSLMRQQALHTLLALMRALPPASVVALCMSHADHPSPRVREELVNVVIAALLTFPAAAFDAVGLSREIARMLGNNKARVKYVAVEALTILASRTGSSAVFDAVRASLSPNEATAAIELLSLRLLDPTLPRMGTDGAVEHLISRSAASTPRPASPGRTPGRNSPAPRMGPVTTDVAALLGKLALQTPTSSVPPSPQSPLSPVGTVSFRHLSKSVPTSPTRRVRLPWERAPLPSGLASPSPSIPAPSQVASALEAAVEEGREPVIYGAGSRAPRSQTQQLMTEVGASRESLEKPSTSASTSHTRGVVSHDETPVGPRSGSVVDPYAEQATPWSARSPESSKPASRQGAPSVEPAPPRIARPQAPRAPTSLKSRQSAAVSGSLTTLATPPATKVPSASVPLEKSLKDLLQRIAGDGDWDDKAAALESLQTLLEGSSAARTDAVATATVHELGQALLAQVANLRTSVSRVALGAMRCYIETFQRLVDPEVDAIAQVLLKKMGESKGFLVTETDRTLDALCVNATPARALTAVLASADHRNAMVRAKCAQLVEQLLSRADSSLAERVASTPSELERLLPVLVAFLRDGAAATRYAARRTLLSLEQRASDPAAWRRNVERIVSASHAVEVWDGLAWARQNPSPPAGAPRAVVAASAAPAVMAARSNASEVPRLRSKPAPMHSGDAPDGDPALALDLIVEDMGANTWTKRLEAITRLGELMQTSASKTALSDPVRFNRWFEAFLLRLHDGNGKVQTHALQTLASILPAMADHLEPVPALLIPALGATAASLNPALRQASCDDLGALVRLLQRAPAPPLGASGATGLQRALINTVETLSAQLLHGSNVRAKAVFTDTLCDLVEVAWRSKPQLLARHFVPVAVQLSSDTSRQDQRAAVQRLVREMYRLVGPALFSVTNPLSRQSGQSLRAVLSPFIDGV